MDFKPISENLKNIVGAMKDLIEKGEAEHLKEDKAGWMYGGMAFMRWVSRLQKEMQDQGFNIYSCAVRHFFKGANILDLPAKQLLIIPINGVSTLSPGGRLLPDTYCYIKNEPTLSGENIDVIFVILEEGKEET